MVSIVTRCASNDDASSNTDKSSQVQEVLDTVFNVLPFLHAVYLFTTDKPVM